MSERVEVAARLRDKLQRELIHLKRNGFELTTVSLSPIDLHVLVAALAPSVGSGERVDTIGQNDQTGASASRYEAVDGWIAVPERFVVAVNEFLADWTKGDFSLSPLAALDASAVVAAKEAWATALAETPDSSPERSSVPPVSELRALSEAATPGPWSDHEGDILDANGFAHLDAAINLAINRPWQDANPNEHWGAHEDSHRDMADGEAEANAAFIVALVNAFRSGRLIPAPAQTPVREVGAGDYGGIYVASKTRHAAMWRGFREAGHPIISTWIDEAGVGETSDWPDLWRRCVAEAAGCGVLVCYAEPGDVLKGALVEVGAALASGRRVIVAGVAEIATFRHHPLVSVEPDLTRALGQARALAAAPPASGARDCPHCGQSAEMMAQDFCGHPAEPVCAMPASDARGVEPEGDR